MNIYLIGYRCTGKTSVSVQLAKNLKWPSIDSDEALTAEQGTTISEIVAEKGWDVFRKMEKAVMSRISTLDKYVVATGGGVILNNKNVVYMKQSGKVVWLKATPEIISKRMALDTNTENQRPSLTIKGVYDEIEETLKIRNPLYENAMDFSVHTDNKSISEICRLIESRLF